MNGAGHRTVGAAAGIALAATTHPEPWKWPLIIAVAAAFSHGPTSPDIDLTRAWHLIDRLVPDEALGNNGPLQHRGISHWWGIPASAAIAVWVLCPPALAWAAWAALTGWTSHLAADFVCGRSGCGRGPGIPLAPWWWHVGVGFASDGAAARVITATAVPVTVAAFTHSWWLPAAADITRQIGA